MAYKVEITVQADYSVIVEAKSKDEATKKVMKQITLSLGELENEDSLCGTESVRVSAKKIREAKG